MKQKRNILSVLVFTIVVVAFPLVNTFIQSRKEYVGKYDFRISKITVTPTKRLEFYNMKGEKITLWNYTILGYEGVNVGDSIYKGERSIPLYVFKQDSTGRYKEYKRFYPSGIYPYSMFCDK